MWLIIGVPLLVMNLTGQPMLGLAPGQLTLMLGLLAVAVGIFRLWTAATMRRRAQPPPPVRRRRVEGASLEYNPEFDFGKPGPQTLRTEEENPNSSNATSRPSPPGFPGGEGE